VLGIFLIGGAASLTRLSRPEVVAPGEASRLRAGVLHGLLTGVFIAAYSVVDGYAVKRAGLSPVAVDYLGNGFRVPLTLVWLFHAKGLDVLGLVEYARARLKPALIIAVLSPIAYVLVLYAARLAPLSQVAPAREVSMLCAALFGGTFLRERHVALRMCGAACIAAGVIALASA
jgi:drug/metabolite transporter (DMT)-like permease